VSKHGKSRSFADALLQPGCFVLGSTIVQFKMDRFDWSTYNSVKLAQRMQIRLPCNNRIIVSSALKVKQHSVLVHTVPRRSTSHPVLHLCAPALVRQSLHVDKSSSFAKTSRSTATVLLQLLPAAMFIVWFIVVSGTLTCPDFWQCRNTFVTTLAERTLASSLCLFMRATVPAFQETLKYFLTGRAAVHG
jgi:hypothetical protein